MTTLSCFCGTTLTVAVQANGRSASLNATACRAANFALNGTPCWST